MEITIKNHRYRTGVLDLFEAMEVTRIVGPVYFAMQVGAAGIVKDAPAPEDIDDPLAALNAMFSSAATALAKIPREDFAYLMRTCFAVCERESGAGWARLTTPNGAMMFQDLSSGDGFKLIKAVVQENLADFFPAAPDSASQDPAGG